MSAQGMYMLWAVSRTIPAPTIDLLSSALKIGTRASLDLANAFAFLTRSPAPLFQTSARINRTSAITRTLVRTLVYHTQRATTNMSCSQTVLSCQTRPMFRSSRLGTNRAIISEIPRAPFGTNHTMLGGRIRVRGSSKL